MRTTSFSDPCSILPAIQNTIFRRPRRIGWLALAIFIFLHVACLAVFFTGINELALGLCGAVYLVQMFGITAGYHRYFSHRSYKTSRWFQFVLGWIGCSAAQAGPIWWASVHRRHHRTSDTPEDLHSPIVYGFWWSHAGWLLSRDSDVTDKQSVKDLIRYPEIRWLDRFYWVPPLVLAGMCFLIGGWSGLTWGFLVSTILSHHATFMVNSVCHLWGRRRFKTNDFSRNNPLVALLTLGEGWHNNHHHYQSSVRQGFRWWEIDMSYYVLWLLARIGLVWDLREPPSAKLRPESAALFSSAPPSSIQLSKDAPSTTN